MFSPDPCSRIYLIPSSCPLSSIKNKGNKMFYFTFIFSFSIVLSFPMQIQVSDLDYKIIFLFPKEFLLTFLQVGLLVISVFFFFFFMSQRLFFLPFHRVISLHSSSISSNILLPHYSDSLPGISQTTKSTQDFHNKKRIQRFLKTTFRFHNLL